MCESLLHLCTSIGVCNASMCHHASGVILGMGSVRGGWGEGAGVVTLQRLPSSTEPLPLPWCLRDWTRYLISSLFTIPKKTNSFMIHANTSNCHAIVFANVKLSMHFKHYAMKFRVFPWINISTVRAVNDHPWLLNMAYWCQAVSDRLNTKYVSVINLDRKIPLYHGYYVKAVK